MATLHDTLFFKSPLNYESDRVEIRGSSTVVTEMTDNSYITFSDEDDVDMDVSDADGNATAIDYIFIKSKNVDSYSFTPSGGSGSGFTDRDMPTSVENFDGNDVDTEVSGFQHDLYALPSDVTATSARLQFTGTDVEIYAVMLLEVGLSIEANARYTEIAFRKVDRAGEVNVNLPGRMRRRPPAERFKWVGDYRCLFTEESVAEFMAWAEANPDFAMAMEFSRYPARVFLATFPELRLSSGYLSVVKPAGEFVGFRVAER